MAFAPHHDRTLPVTGRRRSVPSTMLCALLALAGVLGISAATSIAPPPGIESPAAIDAAAASGHGLLRAPSRVHGLKNSELPLEIKDGEDDGPQPALAASLPWLVRPFLLIEPAALPSNAAASVEPRRNRPQSPRAPPILV